mmetsp:Transcript_461/g.810  ORF Transcript_461/g.810 Transcript_461/m.810 type:complete len:95 (-) Transcript_461:175-459(-)
MMLTKFLQPVKFPCVEYRFWTLKNAFHVEEKTATNRVEGAWSKPAAEEYRDLGLLLFVAHSLERSVAEALYTRVSELPVQTSSSLSFFIDLEVG